MAWVLSAVSCVVAEVDRLRSGRGYADVVVIESGDA